MSHRCVRVIALAVIRRGDDIFVTEYRDAPQFQPYYRPFGGSVEFGEWGRDAVVRELREEIHAEITVARYLGALENIFESNGRRGHEIALVYDATFSDASFNDRQSVEGNDDGDCPLRGVWKPLDFFRKRHAPLYPDGLLELLDRKD